MASPEQIRANRINARKSTGPKETGRTRWNGLKHGLRAEQVVLPGEDRAAFEAELRAFFDDWKPASHTRAVLVERLAVASWRLNRAVRAEAARLAEVGADAAHDFDLTRRELVESSLHLLPRDPGSALARLRSDASGLDCLIGLWDGLARAAADPAGWTSRRDHHDRLLNLLGHPSGSDPEGLEIARVSLALLAANAPEAVRGRGEPRLVADRRADAASALRGLCDERIADLRRVREGFWDPPVLRRRMIDLACAPITKEAQLMHRYEMAHETSFRRALRQLVALEKSGADLPEPSEDEPEAIAESVVEVVAAPAGPEAPRKSNSTNYTSTCCAKLASVGSEVQADPRPGPPAGLPGRPDRPTGADPGPKRPPRRP